MTRPQILINQLCFNLPNGSVLFDQLSLIFSQKKIGLIGRNGVGKSTLLKLILGEIYPNKGSIQIEASFSYVPQNNLPQANVTVAELLDCHEKIKALYRIRQGSVDENDYIILNDDWDIEDKIKKILNQFGLDIPYDRKLDQLSGGEFTRVQLAKIFLNKVDFLLLDEPTNHLDYTARQQFYRAIREWQNGLIIVSHDRELLNGMDEIIELTTLGATYYGGNYDFYAEQKEIEALAKEQQYHDAKKLLQKTNHTIQSSREKHEQKQSYGRKLRRSGHIDKMAANSKKGRSERTQSKLLIKEERMLDHANKLVQVAKDQIEISSEIHINLPNTFVPNGKIILDIKKLYFSYPDTNKMIINNCNFTIQGPERIALVGNNGSGKTTLVKLILNELKPIEGEIYLGTHHLNYLDQNCHLLDLNQSILDNFLRMNSDSNDNDAYQCLAQFLFKNKATHQLVKELSGGEKLRVLLACVLMSKQPPQFLILDEPTNYLDFYSINSIKSALNHYQGALLVVSHDQHFLADLGLTRSINM